MTSTHANGIDGMVAMTPSRPSSSDGPGCCGVGVAITPKKALRWLPLTTLVSGAIAARAPIVVDQGGSPYANARLV